MYYYGLIGSKYMRVLKKFKADIKNGKLKVRDEQGFLSYVSVVEDGEVELLVLKPIKRRTKDQNRLYWGYLKIISEELGNTPNELHEAFKYTFLPTKTITICGDNKIIPKSTTEMTTGEFGEYLDNIEKMTEIQIPDFNLLMENYELIN